MNIDVLITGGGGMLARALTRELVLRGMIVRAPNRAGLNVTNEEEVRDTVRKLRPRIIIQCAAYARVDDAETDEATAQRINATATQYVAEAAREVGARFVYPSTDYVFDGKASEPYAPDAPVRPVNAYGRGKAEGEARAALAENYLVIRTSWLYGPGSRNFVRTIAGRLDQGQATRVVDDQLGRPTWTIDAARGMAQLLAPHIEPGIYHWCNAGTASWFDVAAEIARLKQCPDLIQPCSTAEYPTRAQRPAYSVLDCSKSEQLIGPARDWRLALADAVKTGAY